MCIRDRYTSDDTIYDVAGNTISVDAELTNTGTNDILIYARKLDNDMPAGCLLYTSDAADERSSEDLGGRRIIKKKK